MQDTPPCPRCGTRLLLMHGLQGLCPNCVMIQVVSSGVMPADPSLEEQYAAVNLLGQGPHGTTWLARTLQAPVRTIVVKILKEPLDSEEGATRLDDHLRAVASLTGGEFVPVIDGAVESTGRGYVVSEFVAGRTILAECTRAPIDPAAVFHLFARVCSAVEKAHRLGVFHGHLAPENIRVVGSLDQLSPRLMDFDLPRLLGSGTPDVDSDCGALLQLLDALLAARMTTSHLPIVWQALQSETDSALRDIHSAGEMAAACAKLAARSVADRRTG